ncbi:hypothetical protein [Pyrococcus kukulkanii]|uniref:hypothetical protein n=1 Tax=Pyrococcus kukulkanii TaxID=1609559 RepID=UPI003566E211
MERRTLAKNAKSLLYWGSILSLFSLIPIIGSLLGLIGVILYFVGLYEWKDVDDRPFTLGIVQLILGLFYVVLLIIGMESGFFSTLSFSKAFYIGLLYTYPLTAIVTMLTRYQVQYFYEATEEESFLTAKKLYLVGILTFPFIVGIFIGFAGRIFEIIGYSHMTDTPKVLKGREFGIDIRQMGAIFVYALVLSLLIIHVMTPRYDITLRKGKVEVFIKKGEVYEVKVVYHGRCWGSCIKEISVDGKVVYWGNSYSYVNDKQVVTLKISANSSMLTINAQDGVYTFSLS